MRILIPFILVFTVAFPAHAQEESTLLDYKGKPGYWFPLETGDRMLKDLKELPLLRQKVSLLEEKLQIKDDALALYVRDAELSDLISQKWKAALESQVALTLEQEKYYKSELARLDAWYRQPSLWFGIGFVVAAGLAVGLNYGLSQTQ